jgi:hypothetical protein
MQELLNVKAAGTYSDHSALKGCESLWVTYNWTIRWNSLLNPPSEDFCNNLILQGYSLEPGSSGSIVYGYGLDDRAIQVRSPAEAKEFSCSLCVQAGSGAHPASCPMGTRGHSPGVKRGRGVTLTIHPQLVLRSWMSRSYTSSRLCSSIGVLWDWFTFKDTVQVFYFAQTCSLK